MKNQLIIVFFLILAGSFSYGQGINKNWEEDLKALLTEFKDCKSSADSVSCYKYFGQSLRTVYNINDFYSQSLGRNMTVDEIAGFLSESSQWKLLGKGYEQAALMEAQKHANAGKAVVAVYLNNEGLGHMSLVLPGELKLSGTWNLQAPNSSSFSSVDPGDSYVNKALSYAFKGSQVIRVLLYGRN